jgi:hypothetical protein
MTVTVDETRGALSTNVVYVGTDGRRKAAVVIHVGENGERKLQVFSPTGRIYAKDNVVPMENEESTVCWF